MFPSIGRSIWRTSIRLFRGTRSLSSLSSRFTSEIAPRRLNSVNMTYKTVIPIHRYISTSTVMFDEDRNRFRNMFLFMQEGKYDDAINEIDRCYKGGYALPRSDILMLVARFTEAQRYDLIKRLSKHVSSSNPLLYSELAPLFCYVLLLEGTATDAFSLISQSGDNFLAFQKSIHEEKEEETPSEPSSFSLPQEFLFAKLCIQLLSDIQGHNIHITPLSQTLPRRDHHSEPSDFHLPDIILCYLYTCNYLISALHHDSSTVPETLRDLFPSPYTHSETIRNLEQWSFSSFTLHYASQRLQSTLRSLVLLLWYSYSRSVFEAFPAQNEDLVAMGMTEAIEKVYEGLKNEYDFWNEELFQFFIFYFSQPNSEAIKSANSMRNSVIVGELLSEMGKRGMLIMSPLAVTLFRKNDLQTESFHRIIHFFLNSNRTRTELDSLLRNDVSLLREYVWECGKRNDSQSLIDFYDQLCYLNLHVDEQTINDILFVSCYIQTHSLRKRVVNDMQTRGIPISDPVLCAVLFVECMEKEDISSDLKRLPSQLDESWKLKLTHLLLQMNPIHFGGRTSSPDDWKQSNSVDVLSLFCKEKGIQLNSTACQCLFDWYCKERDYRNALHVFNYIKRKGLKIPPEKFSQMSQTVKSISESRKRLFGSGSVLERVMENPNQLPRQTNRYLADKANPVIRQALCLFKKDFSAVSINSIIGSFVQQFCKDSIVNYDSWL